MQPISKRSIAIASVIALVVLVVVISLRRSPTDSNVVRRSAAGSNVSEGRAVTASSTYESSAPSNVLDGDPSTTWNAGPSPPAWIEIDLGASCEINLVWLLVEQTPAGLTVHNCSFGTEARVFSAPEVLSQQTVDGQELTCATDSVQRDVRFVRVETTLSPSWVAWKEIEI